LKKLRYLIAKDVDPGTDDSITVIGYEATTPPKNGAKYINLRDEYDAGTYGPYLPSDDIDDQYNEPAPDPAHRGFWDNLESQLDRAKTQGFTSVELDNCDTYTASVVLLAYNAVASRGLTVWAKNPALVDGNREAILAHSAVVGVIVERDCGTPATYDAMRRAVGKPDLPIRFVSYGGGKQWAQQTAGTIQAGAYRNMGVTYSSEGEYGSSEDILLPTGNPMPITAPWLEDARSSVGRYHDGPDVPKLAQEVASRFPEVPGLAAYCNLAKNDTPWCGIFVAAMLARCGIKPPFVKGNELKSFMWVDAWLDWGQKIPVGQEQPGDLALYLNSPHHINFVAGNGQYIGGNQSNAVTKIGYRTPDAIRRPLAVAVEKPPPMPMSNRFAICLKRVLKHEGGNDDDPRDPGGRTSRGVTAERWAEYRKTRPDMPADVWQAPQSAIEEIYLKYYWEPLWCDMLPPGVDYAVFDFGVNSGPSRSAKFLQEIVESEVDGEVGPNTVAATKAADPEEVINRLCDDRMEFLRGLSTWGTFGRGWTNRVNDVRRDALADAEAAPTPIDDEPKPVPTPTPAKTIQGVLAQIEVERKAALARIDAMSALVKQAVEFANKPAPLQSGADLLSAVPEWVVPLAWPYIQQMSGDQVLALLKTYKSATKSATSGANTAIIAGSAAAGGLGLGAFIIQILQHFGGG
jgi:lysozyme family protein